ncbi:MAG: CCA tRNA nucleotidyltransferase [Rhabdochlamydiaceae bacterium]
MPGHSFATTVVKRLSKEGHIAYFAGGWVRDYLMKHPSDDIDIATSASVEDIQSIFPKTIPVGVAFGIVIVVEEGHHFEVATFRKEKGYLDGRRPTSIEPASPQEDAQRRDFTINGMFWDPLKKELHDYVEGQKDLKSGIVRAIGDPHERFLEDRLRMIRAVRYSTRFNFPIEPATLQAILSHAPSLLPAVAMERIWQEFKKMSSFAHFDKGLAILHRLNLLPTIFPQLKEIPAEEILKRLEPLAFFPKKAPTITQLLELFPYPDLDQLFELCDYLKLSRAEREIVRFLHHAKQMIGMPPEWLTKLEKIEWAQFYANTYSQVCLEIIAAHFPLEKRESFLQQHHQRIQSLQVPIGRIQSQTPIVRADHLMKQGITPGKKMGVLLKEAERISVNEGIEDREAIMHLLKNSSLWNT